MNDLPSLKQQLAEAEHRVEVARKAVRELLAAISQAHSDAAAELLRRELRVPFHQLSDRMEERDMLSMIVHQMEAGAPRKRPARLDRFPIKHRRLVSVAALPTHAPHSRPLARTARSPADPIGPS
jgi:hypothetical protein